MTYTAGFSLLLPLLISPSVVALIPWWTGGRLFGAIFIALAIVPIPQLDAATLIARLAGQMSAPWRSTHFGPLAIPVHLP
jgi:uncharacterized membrane protein YdcZ (DUF606 family)